MERRKAEAMAGNFSRASSWDVPTVGPVTEHATIGASIVIKGDVSGKEHLFIDGTVKEWIHFPDHRVTIGRSSKVKPDIHAREVVVMGTVQGDIHCADLLDIRGDSHIEGQIITRRARIDDGAFLKGSVEIQHPEKEPREAPRRQRFRRNLKLRSSPRPRRQFHRLGRRRPRNPQKPSPRTCKDWLKVWHGRLLDRAFC
jgi:cytoskeletal protein CcmA (bactofilin family)